MNTNRHATINDTPLRGTTLAQVELDRHSYWIVQLDEPLYGFFDDKPETHSSQPDKPCAFVTKLVVHESNLTATPQHFTT